MRFSTVSVLLALSLLPNPLHAMDLPDEEIVRSIVKIIIEEYDKNRDFSVSERLVLSMSKKAFVETLTDWEKKYTSMPDITVPLNPLIEDIVKIGDKRLDPEKALRLRFLFRRLTFLSYMNFQIYFVSVRKYCMKTDGCLITSTVIDEAISEPEVYHEKLAMYGEEAEIKNEIREIFKTKQASFYFGFYAFAFDYVDKIRAGIIKKDMAAMKKKIESKNRASR